MLDLENFRIGLACDDFSFGFWRTGLFDPGVAPLFQVDIAIAIEDIDQVVPDRVVVSKLAKVFSQPVLHRLLADHRFQLPHHDRRFHINDSAVERSSIFEILKFLLDRIGSLAAVFAISTWMMLEHKAEVVIDVGKARMDNLGRHKVGKDFFQPYVVEPFHGYQVSEPHVRRFVSDQASPIEFLIFSRRFVQEKSVGVIKNVANVFHPSVLE